MLALPLVGWGMLSAGHYPIVMFGPLHLPPILPANPTVYAVLRKTHTILAYLLFVTFLAHLSAVLFHTLIVRDGSCIAWLYGPSSPAKQKSKVIKNDSGLSLEKAIEEPTRTMHPKIFPGPPKSFWVPNGQNRLPA